MVLEDRRPHTVQIATSLAVMVFNSGRQSFMDKIGVQAGPLCIAHLASRDRARLATASYVESQETKKRRKSKRRLGRGCDI